MAIASKVMSRVPARMLVPYIAWQYQLYEPELGLGSKNLSRPTEVLSMRVCGGAHGRGGWQPGHPRVEAFEPNASLVNRLRVCNAFKC